MAQRMPTFHHACKQYKLWTPEQSSASSCCAHLSWVQVVECDFQPLPCHDYLSRCCKQTDVLTLQHALSSEEEERVHTAGRLGVGVLQRHTHG